MFKKTLLAVAILSLSTAAMADNVQSVTTYFNIPTGCAILFDKTQLRPSDSMRLLTGDHTVSVRCGSESKFTDYNIGFTSGSFYLNYSSPAGYTKYPVSAIVNANCPINSKASQGTINTPVNSGDNIAIYFNQNFTPTGSCKGQ